MPSELLLPNDKIITDRYQFRREDRLSAEELDGLTPQDVIERIRALQPFFAERAEANEKLLRPCDESWRAVLKSGCMYLGIHKRFGGLQGNLQDIVTAMGLISEVDASLAWVAMFVINTPRQIAGYPLAVQEMVYEKSGCPVVTNMIAPTGTARRVEGGYRLSGRYAWCTTIQVTDWLSMIAQVINEDGTKGPAQPFLAPNTPENCTIVETWNAYGMIGTGTHHVIVEDLLVPDDMASVLNQEDAAWGAKADFLPDYKYLHTAQGPHASVCIAAPLVAAAKGAVEYARQRLLHYSKRGSTQPEKEKMSTQMRLAKASALASAAELLVHEAARITNDELAGPGAATMDAAYEVKAWMGEAVELARQVVTLLMQSAGTSVHYMSSPIGRAFRDVHVGSSHFSSDYDSCMLDWGKRMLGEEIQGRLPIGDRNKVRDELAATRGDYSRTNEEYVDVRPI